jgi:hypothetical protein
LYGSVERLLARTHRPSRATRCCTPAPESAGPVGPCSGVSWRRWVSPESLPEVLPEKVLPGVAFPPVGPWDLGSPPSRPGAPRSRPAVLCSATTATRPSRGRAGLPLLPRSLGARLWLCVPCLRTARVRGGRLLATPGVFPALGGTPPPALPPGDHGLSHVPESPLWRPAPLSDPGGVLPTRRSASRTAAFRSLHPVGFGLAPAAALLLTTTLHIAGLPHAACLLTRSSFVLPLLGWHVEFAPDLLARR